MTIRVLGRQKASDTDNLAADDATSDVAPSETPDDSSADRRGHVHMQWRRLLAYGVLPAAAMLLAMTCGWLKWIDLEARDLQTARIESTRAATDGTLAMLSYRPDTVDQDVEAARHWLTGPLKDSYNALTRDVVIPGAQQKHITSVATVPAAASVAVSQNRAEVLVFVDQSITMGDDPPTDTASRVRVTLDNVDGRWLMAGFDPI